MNTEFDHQPGQNTLLPFSDRELARETPVLYENKPHEGFSVNMPCNICGTEYTVYYRLDRIEETNTDSVVWNSTE